MMPRVLSTILLSVVIASPSTVAQPQPTAPAAVRKLSRSERKEHIKNLAEKYRHFLADVEPIMQPEELDVFLQLESDAQRDLYIDDFWRRRGAVQGLSATVVREQYYDRLQTAKEKFKSLASERSRVFVIHGAPAEVKSYGGFASGCRLIQPIEVWTYPFLPNIGRGVHLIFYVPRGFSDYQLWVRGELSELISSEVMVWAENSEAEAVRRVFGINTNQCKYQNITTLECECSDGREIIRVIEAGRGAHVTWLKVFEPPVVNPEDVKRILRSVVLANPAAPQLAADFSVAFPSRQGNRADAQITMLVSRSKLVPKEISGVKLYSVDVVGEVLKDDQLFEHYRYRFDFPADAAGDQLPVIIDRFLPAAEYRSRIKISDVNSNAEVIVDKPIMVPQLTTISRSSANGVDDSASSQAPLRIVPLPDQLLSGPQHVDTIVAGEGIKAVEFYLDGTKVMTKRSAPFALDLDLGTVPQPHRIRAIGLNSKGEFVGGDEVVVNGGGGDFRVRIVSPRVAMKLSGPTRVEAAVDVPEGKKLSRLELYVNETRVATMYAPPYMQTIDLPSKLSYVRAVATIDDDESQVEDVVVINAPASMAEVSVHLVDVPVIVTRDSRPVTDLPQSAFTVLDDGKPVTLARFEHVTDVPLSIGLAIDTSTSMQPRLAEAQKAGAQFLSNVMKKGDKAFLLTFDVEPHIVQRWSANVSDLAAGLARLRTEEATALYDAIIYSLYNFAPAKGQKALVVITDGRDTSSKFTFDQALEYARRAAVPVYAIGLGIRPGDIDVRYRLGKLCAETGGNAYYIDQVADLERTYRDIQNELRSQYLLGFYPAEAAKPGSTWHSITVQVSGAQVKTIRGYYGK